MSGIADLANAPALKGVFARLQERFAPHNLATFDEESLIAAHTLIDNIMNVLIDFLPDNSPLVARDAIVHPTAILGERVVIFPGAYVGPYCYLRGHTLVFPGCHLGYLVETDKAVIFDNTQIHHSAVIGQSIIGAGCNIGFSFATATKTVTGRPTRVHCCENHWYESKAVHHGAVLGRQVVAGTQVSLMPGASVMAQVRLYPHVRVGGYVTNDVRNSNV
jgi:UDP-3-O-[3-hydroxymyristoyl] glucosamine N-acyltransferase